MPAEIEQNDIEEVVEVVKSPKPKNKSKDGFNLGKLEDFYEDNKKAINYGGGALLAIIAIFSYYKLSYLPGLEKEANNEFFYAQNYFEKDSFNIALNGGILVPSSIGPKTMIGLKEIADTYSSTEAGNLANFYAGISLLRTGKFEEAIEYLEAFDGTDEIIAPLAIGAIGDANLELNKVDEAIKYYLNASEKSSNTFTSPIFLKKAALAYELNKNYTDALALYERLKNEYAKSKEAREIEKYISRVKVLGNIE
jgi:tetratricopeptide (TPR) repeat protein